MSLVAKTPKEDRFLQWMDRTAQEQLRRRQNAIADIRTVLDAEHRKDFVRKTILSG